MTDEPWLTTGEIAREVGVDPSTINRYVRSGLITPTETTLGGHRRWKLSDFMTQMRELRESTPDPDADHDADERDGLSRNEPDRYRDAGR